MLEDDKLIYYKDCGIKGTAEGQVSKIFKSSDIRGLYPKEFSENLAYLAGLAFGNQFPDMKSVVTGIDARASSNLLQCFFNIGLMDAGVRVFDIGLCATEMVYFAVDEYDCDGGAMITASHNPLPYNGIKLIYKGCMVYEKNGLFEMRDRILNKKTFGIIGGRGNISTINNIVQKYIDKYLKDYEFEGQRIVANPGNGCASILAEDALKAIKLDVNWLYKECDGSFPNGVPNPIIDDQINKMKSLMSAYKEQIGVAWDADADRVIFYDENGQFVDSYYIVVLLAQYFLQKDSNALILHDLRAYWAILDVVQEYEGRSKAVRVGHAWFKDEMRKSYAVYGGELSGHHYFQLFGNFDSGILPIVYILDIMKKESMSLVDLISNLREKYPISGEMNFKCKEPQKALSVLKETYSSHAIKMNEFDGLSCEFEGNWRFNLRVSNNEPLIRLNLESRNDKEILVTKRNEIVNIIESVTKLEVK